MLNKKTFMYVFFINTEIRVILSMFLSSRIKWPTSGVVYP